MPDYAKRRLYNALLFADLTAASNNGFQELVAKYLAAIYADDFQPIISVGNAGDAGCDGYRISTKTVYQCYGKQRNSALSISRITDKITDDFAKARKAYPGNAMLEWTFVHNITEGLPNDVNILLQKLRIENPTVRISTMTKDALASALFKLPEEELSVLFAPAARTFSDVDSSDIQRLLQQLVAHPSPSSPGEPLPVPCDKVERNRLGEPSARVIRDSAQYTPQVAKFVNESFDLDFGDRCANVLTDRYVSLESQGLTPDEVFQSLVDFVIGDDRVGFFPGEIKAAETILTYFFQTCAVFKSFLPPE